MPTATLKIFLAYGDPKRLRTAELSNWTGKAVSGPRSEFDKVLARDESLSSGVSAAATIHGGSANGLTAWVNSDGKQLKQLQNV